ncbi:uncharacterized protein LOC125179462 [Hyalella azteca]|uniref:Uncharacterized protein LOC125179462 n=1 Tax=Hyalella azteca TaxID=294128 RepID=A0A979FY72_HYAAZ|nr:uncharacterized protein LOC125179462 [Hyalella azteca]
MQNRFSKLDKQLRQLFTEPISLLHFCSIYKQTPEKIDRWRSFNDVSRDTLQLQKTIVADKLISIGSSNDDVLIDDLFMVIGQWALEFLGCNKITFTDAERTRLQRKCCDKINLHCQGADVDAGVFLNVMLKVTRSLSGSAGTTYSFAHKSTQERLAAHYITEQMLGTDKPSLTDMGVTPETSPSFLEVLQYVLQDLSSSSPRQFQKRWPQLRDALTAAGVTRGGDWQAVLLRSPEVTALAKHAAKITIKETDVWDVHSGESM